MDLKTQFTTVTTLSKILAALVFIALPFIGFYFGMQYNASTISSTPPSFSEGSVELSGLVKIYLAGSKSAYASFVTDDGKEYAYDVQNPSCNTIVSALSGHIKVGAKKVDKNQFLGWYVGEPKDGYIKITDCPNN